MNPPIDPEPMMSLDMFTEQMGLSKTTIWRFRNEGCSRQLTSMDDSTFLGLKLHGLTRELWLGNLQE